MLIISPGAGDQEYSWSAPGRQKSSFRLLLILFLPFSDEQKTSSFKTQNTQIEDHKFNMF